MVTHLCPFQQARYTRNCNISAGNSTQSGGTRLHPQAATVAVLGDLRFVPIGVFLPAPNALATLAYPRHTHRHRQTTAMHTSGLVPFTRLVDGLCPDRATGGYLVGVLLRLKPGSLARRSDHRVITIGRGRRTRTNRLVWGRVTTTRYVHRTLTPRVPESYWGSNTLPHTRTSPPQ